MGEPAEELGTKRCSKCGEEKPRAAFNRLRSASDGLQYRCKLCQREASLAAHRAKADDPALRAAAVRRSVEWHRKNRDASRRHSRRRHDKRRGVEIEWAEVLRRDVCAYCGGTGGEVDHIEPDLSEGTFENLTAACRNCNAQKHQKPFLLFMLERTAG